MEVFRIAKEAYSKTLSTSGAANRWNIDGQFVFYAGSSRSLSILELIVHRGVAVPFEKYRVMVISLADDDHLYRQVHIKELPTNWRSYDACSSLQKIGSDWISSQESLILKIPSAVIPREYNYVINTEHPEFTKKVHLSRTEPYFWDSHLL